MKRQINTHKPVYAFDICNELIAEFKDVHEFTRSDFYKKWFGHITGHRAGRENILRFSTKRKQHCGYAKIFITHDKDFWVNYTSEASNHNPLRITKTIAYHAGMSDMTISECDSAFYIKWISHTHYDAAQDCLREIQVGIIALNEYEKYNANFEVDRRRVIDIMLLHEYFLTINNHYQLHS